MRIIITPRITWAFSAHNAKTKDPFKLNFNSAVIECFSVSLPPQATHTPPTNTRVYYNIVTDARDTIVKM